MSGEDPSRKNREKRESFKKEYQKPSTDIGNGNFPERI